MDLGNGGNTLALITAATALALGVWDRINSRRSTKDTAEADFRNDLIERCRDLSTEKEELQKKYDELLMDCFEQKSQLILYRNCVNPTCPFNRHLVINKNKHKDGYPEIDTDKKD